MVPYYIYTAFSRYQLIVIDTGRKRRISQNGDRSFRLMIISYPVTLCPIQLMRIRVGEGLERVVWAEN